MSKIILKDLDFEKHHGLGNDYIIINNLKWEFSDEHISKLAKKLCTPHFSVGADGMLFVCDSEHTDIFMKMFNPDGTEAEMCGNGIRCFAKYIYENNIVKKEMIHIETLKGIISAKLNIEKNIVKTVKIDMGPPILDCDQIPVNLNESIDRCVNESIAIIDKIFKFTAVSMGNPHVIIFTNELFNDDQLNKYGAAIESHKYFPNKTNVEFVNIISKQEAQLRVFERGVGITKSCGTGNCAAVVAGTILGKFTRNNPVLVHNDGGDLIITFDGKNVFMEGPAERVFRGIIDEIEI